MKVIEVTHPIQEDQLIKEDVAMAFGFLMACIVVIIKCLKHWMNAAAQNLKGSNNIRSSSFCCVKS